MADMMAASASPVVAPSAQAPATTEGKSQQGASPVKEALSPFKGTKHKTVVDGVTQEVEYDELLAGYQKAKASDKKFQEAATRQKEWDAIVGGLSSGDPRAWELLKQTVPKEVFKKVAFDFAYQEMEYENLSPDKKRELELNERQRKLDEEEARRNQDSQSKEKQAQINASAEHLQRTLDEFVEKSGKRPNSEELYRMTEIMLAHIHKHGAMPSIDQLYDRVSRRMDTDALSVLQKRSADVGEMVKWMPPDILKALKQHFTNEAMAGQPKRHQPNTSQDGQVRRRGEPKKLGIDAAFKQMENRIKGKR